MKENCYLWEWGLEGNGEREEWEQSHSDEEAVTVF